MFVNESYAPMMHPKLIIQTLSKAINTTYYFFNWTQRQFDLQCSCQQDTEKYQLEQNLFISYSTNSQEVRSKCGIFRVVKYMRSMAICFVQKIAVF